MDAKVNKYYRANSGIIFCLMLLFSLASCSGVLQSIGTYEDYSPGVHDDTEDEPHYVFEGLNRNEIEALMKDDGFKSVKFFDIDDNATVHIFEKKYKGDNLADLQGKNWGYMHCMIFTLGLCEIPSTLAGLVSTPVRLLKVTTFRYFVVYNESNKFLDFMFLENEKVIVDFKNNKYKSLVVGENSLD